MIERRSHGTFLLQDGDTPRSVAEVVYGDGSRYAILLKYNPEQWVPGTRIEVPNKAGRSTTVEDGEQTRDLIARMFKNQPVHLYLKRYYQWNGMREATDLVGETVFIPER